MKERGIPFTGESVRAIQEDQKTMTRRVVKGRWLPLVEEVLRINGKWVFDTVAYDLTTPYGNVGDRLWVKETYCELDPPETAFINGTMRLVYRQELDSAGKKLPEGPRWKPATHMPKWAARIWLEITGLRAERLQEITGDDVEAEGCNGLDIGRIFQTPRDEYMLLWDTLNAKRGYPWASNPWVWVISFKRVELTLVPVM